MFYKIFTILLLFGYNSYAQTYSALNASVTFNSTAPLEIIIASSNELNGALNMANNSFAFKLYVKSFEGFINPLQKVHFYENYMETDSYPLSIFKGKILEPITQGKGQYRAKGSLEIHGVEKEVIIDVELDVDNKQIEFSSEFEILLLDYDIEIPRIVEQKIAKVIQVKTSGILIERE